MSFIDQTRRPSPASMVAVVAVHAALGAALLAGLTVSGAIPDIITEFEATNIPIEPPPLPTDPVEPVPHETIETVIHTPSPPLDLKPVKPTIETTPLVIPLPPRPVPGLGVETPKPTPRPSFDPVGARPRNDPGAWLSNDDYRPAWIRRELTGLASFQLEIAANGRVTDCRVTGSTGHDELDAATCKLVARRARFEPARGGNGEAVSGSYTGSVLWQLPE